MIETHRSEARLWADPTCLQETVEVETVEVERVDAIGH